MEKLKAILLNENSVSSQVGDIIGSRTAIKNYVKKQADKYCDNDGYKILVDNEYMFKVEFEDYRGGKTVKTAHFNMMLPTIVN